jgi:molybdopterin-containing oxidoreductase family iron-sulfur binding subunit
MSSLDAKPQKTYWRSLAELADAPEFRAFADAEFPAADDPGGLSRRRWLQLMGASLALAGVAGCRWEQRELRPFAERPADRIPGRAEHFATAIQTGERVLGLLVTTVDGRPIKIEGNPEHPESLGATDTFAQASILELYDPDRSRDVRNRAEGAVRTWDEFAAAARAALGKLPRGEGLAVLAQPSSSPSLGAAREALLEAYPAAKWHEYAPLSDDNSRAGARLAFGKPFRAQLALGEARVVVCLDCDLFGEHPSAVRLSREFAARRLPDKDWMNRLYAVEGVYSTTGVAADHRLAVRPSEVQGIAAELERAVGSLAADAEAKTSDPAKAEGPQESDPARRLIEAMAKDLANNRGRSLVVAGEGQPPEVHAAAHRINAVLGNTGKTVRYTAEPNAERAPHLKAIAELADAMRAGLVKALWILGGNPAYDAPADLGFAEALEKVPFSVRLGLYEDETSQRTAWHLPQAHWLESWGDLRAYDGTYSVVQPLIEPLYGGRTAIEVIELLRRERPATGQELVRGVFKRLFGEADWEGRWRQAVHDGLVAQSAFKSESPELASVAKNGAPQAKSPDSPSARPWEGGPLQILFCPSASVLDGRFANNGWLQELPDPITKVTWDNAAWIAPATAAKLGVRDDQVVRLSHAGKEVELPAVIVPGMAPGMVAVGLGYGRTMAGRVGGNRQQDIATVGVDVYPMRTRSAFWLAREATLTPTDKTHKLAVTQDHFAIDEVGKEGRERKAAHQIREATLEEYRKDPEFARHATHHPPLVSLWNEFKYVGARWGMAIDLNKCLGCNACVMACQAENNVPIVGRERVLRGREMHWIRLDRYFRGDPDSASAAFEPMLCQHCELAPCEAVCPVAATVHSQEGLNEMVYNRCVGTRYCSNNCPYKVRRFNFFNYHKEMEKPENEVLKMVFNPEVTVRHRGVMEKCTFCVQRIQNARIEAKNNRRPIEDRQLQTACQQACPSQAIVFGDLNAPESEVARLHALDRAYAVLAELNTRPRTAYLARVRNPNPELA